MEPEAIIECLHSLKAGFSENMTENITVPYNPIYNSNKFPWRSDIQRGLSMISEQIAELNKNIYSLTEKLSENRSGYVKRDIYGGITR